jgi:hypothetical protein
MTTAKSSIVVLAAVLAWTITIASTAQGFVVVVGPQVPSGSSHRGLLAAAAPAAAARTMRMGAAKESGSDRRDALFGAGAMALSSAVLLGSLSLPLPALAAAAAAAGGSASSFYPQVRPLNKRKARLSQRLIMYRLVLSPSRWSHSDTSD